MDGSSARPDGREVLASVDVLLPAEVVQSLGLQPPLGDSGGDIVGPVSVQCAGFELRIHVNVTISQDQHK